MSILAGFTPGVLAAIGERIMPSGRNVPADGAAYMQALRALKSRHGLDTDTIVSLIQAVDTPAKALELLDDGLPAEYVLAMGASSA